MEDHKPDKAKCELDTCCGCCGVQEGVQVVAITSVINGLLRMLPSVGGKGEMYAAGVVLGSLQVVFGIYGYYGAEQLSGYKVRMYLVWISLVLVLNLVYLATSYALTDSFCTSHNCVKASDGYCTLEVCEVIEDDKGVDQYYKLPCLVEDGKPSHRECLSAVHADLIVEMLMVIPLSIYYIVVVWSLYRKIQRSALSECVAAPVPVVMPAPEEEETVLLGGHSDDLPEHEQEIDSPPEYHDPETSPKGHPDPTDPGFDSYMKEMGLDDREQEEFDEEL